MEKVKTMRITSSVILMILLSNIADAQLNAQNDLFSTLENSCNNYLDVSANDNLDSLPLTQLQILSQPVNGTASVNGNFISYCPDSGFVGADNFEYQIIAGGQTDSATVYLNVYLPNNFIFPGDADQNSRVENYDVLALGLAYNLTGPSRFDSTSVNSLAWSPSSYINSNPGAADCDGNGIVESADLLFIENFYHDTYPYPQSFAIDTSECRTNGIPFFVESLSDDTVADGDTLQVAVKLGNDFDLNEAYGIAFTLEFDNRFVSGIGTTLNTSSSWLLQNDAGLVFSRSFQNSGEIEIALTKINHQPENGGGVLMIARMPIDDNIDGIIEPTGNYLFDIKLKKARLVSPYNILRNVCIQQNNFTYYKAPSGIGKNEKNKFRIYPNPSSGKFFIEAERIQRVEITDITGRGIYFLQTDASDKIQIDISNSAFTAGACFIRVTGNNISTVQKIFLQP